MKILTRLWSPVITTCSKRDGGLFDLLKERYPGRRIVHVGDNRISDIEKAGRKAWTPGSIRM